MSNNLALSQVAAAQNNKEVTINDQAGQLDAALTARLALAIDSTNARTLTNTELRRHFFFDLDPDGGDPPDGAITLTVPSGISRGLFAVINDTGFDVTVEITGQALMPPVIADGEAALLTSDGVNVRLAGGAAAVIEALGDIADVLLAGLAPGQMLRRNGSNQWVNEEIRGEPVSLYMCHCRECQKQSASAFGISVIVKRSDFRLLRGEMNFWSRATDSGGTLCCAFCPACGSRVWHEGINATDTISVKGGSLDAPPDLRSACHIWTARKLPGVVIPETAGQFPGEPD